MFKNLLVINIKNLFRSMFSLHFSSGKSNRKRKPFTAILIGLLFLYVAASLMFSTGILFQSLIFSYYATPLEWLYFALTGIMTFMLTFIGSVFSTQNIIFKGKDNELLLSMPIPPFYILAGRIAVIFILDFIYALIIAVPATAVYFMLTGFSAVKLIIIILSTLLIVVLSTAATSFFGFLLACVSSKFKKSNLLSTVLSIIGFIAYFAFFMNIQKYMQVLIYNGEIIGTAIKKYMPLFYFSGLACTDENLLAFFILAVVCLLLFAASCILISKNFINLANAKKTANRKKYVKSELKTSSAKNALLKKEIARFFTLPIYILNCATGCIMELLFSIFLLLKGEEFLFIGSSMGLNSAGGPLILSAAILGFCSGMCNSASVSITLEGKKIDLLRSMPVDSSDFYYAKYVSNFMIGIIPHIISAVLMSIALETKPLTAITFTVSSVAFFAVTIFVNMLMNTLVPKFDWISEAVAVKQSLSVILGMLMLIVCVSAAYTPYFILSEKISETFYLALLLAACTVICLLFTAYFKKGGKKRYNQMHS